MIPIWAVLYIIIGVFAIGIIIGHEIGLRYARRFASQLLGITSSMLASRMGPGRYYKHEKR